MVLDARLPVLRHRHCVRVASLQVGGVGESGARWQNPTLIVLGQHSVIISSELICPSRERLLSKISVKR